MALHHRANLSRRRSPALVVALFAAGALWLPQTALAQFAPVFGDYKADQQISACAWSPGQLQGALGQTPPDIAQYAPGFVDAVNGALETHARGGCGAQPTAPATVQRGHVASGLVDPGPTPKPPPVVKADPVLARSPVPVVEAAAGAGGVGAPWPPLALAGFALLLLIGGAVGLARYYGLGRLEPGESTAEGPGERLSELAQSAWDRVRRGP